MKTRMALFSTLLIGLVLGAPRISIPRRRNLEGIEDPAVAVAYDRINRWPQFRMLRRLVVSEMRRDEPRGTIVDIGCGPGYLLAVVAKAFPHEHLIGIDVAEEMTEVAARNLQAVGGQPVEFRTGDVQKLPLEDASVDFAVSTLSLHHWVDPRGALGEIYRVLKPGGRMLLFDLRRDVRRGFYAFFRLITGLVVPAPLRRIGEPLGSLESSYTPAELGALLSGTRFSRWQIKPGPIWVFVAGQKREGEG